MKKLIATALLLPLLMNVYSFNIKLNDDSLSNQGFLCKEGAVAFGLLMESNGGEYWNGYWAYYNWCVFGQQ